VRSGCAGGHPASVAGAGLELAALEGEGVIDAVGDTEAVGVGCGLQLAQPSAAISNTPEARGPMTRA
jgi:hypothetical protein